MPELILYTTGFCAPCRSARQVLDYASKSVKFNLTEINASDHPDQAIQNGITSTPTLIGLDNAGKESWRVVGVPRLQELRELITSENNS